MTHAPDDTDDNALDGIDLRMWHVPPPAELNRPSLLERALAPAEARPRGARLAWMLAAVVLVNAVVATLIVIFLARPAPSLVATAPPAGGGSIDAEVRALLVRLEREQRDLERRLTEIQELRALVVELSEKVRRFEEREARRDRSPPAPRPPVEAEDAVTPPAVERCDEVYCVLMNYEGACCTKFRPPGKPVITRLPPEDLPAGLDRQSISDGIAAVKARVRACAGVSTARGQVKARIRVGADGRVTSVSIDRAPDAPLGACVAAAVRTAVFARTHGGGSFSYPFVF